MNKISILLLCLISVTLFSCSNEEDPKLPEIEPGKFYGDIGRVGYNLINDKWNQRVKTTHFDSICIESALKTLFFQIAEKSDFAGQFRLFLLKINLFTIICILKHKLVIYRDVFCPESAL